MVNYKKKCEIANESILSLFNTINLYEEFNFLILLLIKSIILRIIEQKQNFKNVLNLE